MALQIISCKRKTGTFKDVPYDNFNFICADYLSTNKSLIFGPDVEEIKIKADNFMTALGRNFAALGDKYKGATVRNLEGMLITPVYDKFGHCVDFTLAVDSAPEKVATGK